MAIDDSGEWWTGTESTDIEMYLEELTARGNGYPANSFRQVVCPCGSNRFGLERAGSITQRICVTCEHVSYISRFGGLGWEEAISEEEHESYSCVGCDCETVNVCVGFADYTHHPGTKSNAATLPIDAVLWFFVGVRCSACGILSCFNDGKVGRGPFADATFREITGEVPHKPGRRK